MDAERQQPNPTRILIASNLSHARFVLTQGDGNVIEIEHKMSDRDENLIDIVLMMLDPA